MDLYTLPVPGTDGKTCAEVFEQAGCDTPASPSCAACLGGPRDTYARMNEAQVIHLYVYIFFTSDLCFSISCRRVQVENRIHLTL